MSCFPLNSSQASHLSAMMTSHSHRRQVDTTQLCNFNFNFNMKLMLPPPPVELEVTVRQQQLLGAVFATCQQLICRSKICAPIIISDLNDIFLRDTHRRTRLAVFAAHSGLRCMAVHCMHLFPFVRSFYRTTKKALPKDAAAVWSAVFPAPAHPVQTPAQSVPEVSYVPCS